MSLRRAREHLSTQLANIFAGCIPGVGRRRSSAPKSNVKITWAIGRICLLGQGLLAFSATPGFAASSSGGLDTQTLFLVQIGLLLLFGRLFGEAAQRIGQPAVIGQLIAGVVLGPSVLGLLWPQGEAALFPDSREQKNMIDAVSQLGVLMLLLLTGMETDLRLVRKVGRAAFSVSITGILIPFACGFSLGEFLPDSMLPRSELRLVTSLFLGTALSISSVKIVAMVVREMDFMRRNLGQVIIASAIIDDTIGWIIIAVIFGIAQHGSVELASLAWSVAGVCIFLAVSLTFGGRAVSMLIRFVNDNFVSDVPVITAILLVMILMALITHAIGVHTVLGAFVAGILVGQSPILTRHIDEQLRGLIVALFMPVFFGLAGLGADFRVLADPWLLALAAGFIAVASLGKFLGAGLGGAIGGLSSRESLALGFAMNARGSTEVIVATIGLSMGALNHTLFTMIVAMAIITTMIMPPSLRWALARLPLGAEEKQRLDRETFEANGFTASLDRFLVAVDGGPSGRLASRLAGLLAGTRQKPVTILELPGGVAEGQQTASRVAMDAAQKAGTTTADESARPMATDVTTRQGQGAAEQAVAAEADKGYDLLFLGFEDATSQDGGFSARMSRAAAAFEGCLALTLAQGLPDSDPAGGPLRILVPISGNAVSRRAAETAVALARAEAVGVTGIYVSNTEAPKQWHYRWRHALADNEAAMLKEFVALADRYGVPARTVVRRDAAVEQTILGEIEQGKHTLLILGVSRRSGEDLFFGNVAKGLVRRRPISMLLLAT